jgi:hypothetical protein
MKKFKEFWENYYPYFLDVWQYLLIVLIFLIGLIFIL